LDYDAIEEKLATLAVQTGRDLKQNNVSNIGENVRTAKSVFFEAYCIDIQYHHSYHRRSEGGVVFSCVRLCLFVRLSVSLSTR